MEAKINIAAILESKPQGTKLYSLTYGDCSYQGYTGDFGIECQSQNGVQFNLDEYGKYCIEGECILFPSKEMRDWSKISWEKGDVLVSNDGGTEVIFYNWYDDTYTNFYGKHRLDSENKNNIKYNDAFLLCTTGRYSLEDKDAAQTYINTIEERLGGKLNLETLEIEKQPEFKDGDILSNPSTALPKNHIFIFSKFNKYKDFEHHVALTASGEITIPTSHGAWCRKDSGVKYATEEEKQQLFEALAKKNKAWDAEKKAIVDLKPKWTPKPFDKIVAFEEMSKEWVCDMFSHYSKNYEDKEVIVTLGGCTYFKALPFNEETAKLIGTTKDVEE